MGVLVAQLAGVAQVGVAVLLLTGDKVSGSVQRRDRFAFFSVVDTIRISVSLFHSLRCASFELSIWSANMARVV